MHYFQMGMGLGPELPAFAGLALIVLLVWKGLALWRAAKRGDKIWFVVFLIVNTVGILEIIYLFFIAGAKLSDFKMSDTKNSN